MAHGTSRNSASPGAHSSAQNKRAAASNGAAQASNGRGDAVEADGRRHWIRSETRELPEVRRLIIQGRRRGYLTLDDAQC